MRAFIAGCVREEHEESTEEDKKRCPAGKTVTVRMEPGTRAGF
jgi:hypothetical protein